VADGSLVLTVLTTDAAAGEVTCRVENSAAIGERKNMNLPGVVVDLPTLTDKDINDIREWGVKYQVDFIAASFVRKASDVTKIREVLGEDGKGIHIISKIENQEGMENYDDILKETDAIMVARCVGVGCAVCCAGSCPLSIFLFVCSLIASYSTHTTAATWAWKFHQKRFFWPRK